MPTRGRPSGLEDGSGILCCGERVEALSAVDPVLGEDDEASRRSAARTLWG